MPPDWLRTAARRVPGARRLKQAIRPYEKPPEFAPPDLRLFRIRQKAFVRFAYNALMRRAPDEGGWRTYVEGLADRSLSREDVLDHLRGSMEFRDNMWFRDLLVSLHHSRCDFVRSMPRARRILDLGGTHQGDRAGAFVRMGYPYGFEELTIVDLPHEDRHEIYRLSEVADRVQTDKGPVVYRYHSMADLSEYADESFDLVYSGQTIEHVTEAECDLVLAEVRRVLEPGGWFGVDTPNGPVCRLQQEDFINPDHKVEYSHKEFTEKLLAAGYEIVDAKGLNYIGQVRDTRHFVAREVAYYSGMYHDIESCYLLAYLCRKPA
jgi:ubiquinone/menaquinone biosynthesis C-methylase UbiE